MTQNTLHFPSDVYEVGFNIKYKNQTKLSVGYCMTSAARQYELEGLKKEVIEALIEVLSQKLPGETEKS
jgi:hypothetical protein